MDRVQNVDGTTYAQGTPGHSQETNQHQPIFSDQELDTYFGTMENSNATIPLGINVDNLINRERLRNILNIIEQSPAGRNVLIVLKNLLGNTPNKRIFFAETDMVALGRANFSKILEDCSTSLSELGCVPGLWSQEELTSILFNRGENVKELLLSKIESLDMEMLLKILKTLNEIYSHVNGVSQRDIDNIKICLENLCNYSFDPNNTQDAYILNISTEVIPIERLVFDGEKIITKNMEEILGSKKALEAYIITHELVHLISYITFEEAVRQNSGIEKWNDRKKNWEKFLLSPRMANIYKNLKKGKIFTREKILKEKIYNAFTNLFTNVEEARNLLGFVPEGSSIPIGEFFLFNEQEKYLLPTYLTEVKELTDIEKDVLNTIANAKGFEISLQNGSMTAEERKCLEVNSNDFRSYIDIEEKMLDNTQTEVLSIEPQNITKEVLSGYQLVNVSGSNNNCGVRALLTTINGADTADENTIKQQRQNALQAFNTYLETHADHNKSQQTIEQTRDRIENSGQMLTTEDFQWFASSLNTPIAIVVQGPNGEISYRHFSNTGDITNPNGIPNQDAFLNLIGQQPNTIVIYHSGIHFQALVPNS